MGIQSHCLVSPSFAEPVPSIGSPSVFPLSLSGDPSSSTTQIRVISQGHHEEQENIRTQGESDRDATTISMLPDNVLLETFDFYRKDQDDTLHELSEWNLWKWRFLVHVCHRWRQIVFASPCRLNLQILCTNRTPVKNNLGIWPAFPIAIDYGLRCSTTANDEDNILAALKPFNRVCDVRFELLDSQLEKIATAMQEPFPVLTRFSLAPWMGKVLALPAGFLGGSAPCLQEITLYNTSYPALLTLLLSTSNLVKLNLNSIPPIGYISPEAMVASLAALPRLEIFVIGFRFDTPRPDRIPPPPSTRTVLPALTTFEFQGDYGHLEDLVGRIDCPQLNRILIDYTCQLDHDFQLTQLPKFIDRSVGPNLTKCRHAKVNFDLRWVSFDCWHCANDLDQHWRPPTITISYAGINWPDTLLSQVFSHFPAALSNVVHLELEGTPEEYQFASPIAEWLHLLHRFSTVQTLLVHEKFAGHVALALEDITEEMDTELLPSLELICLEAKGASPIMIEKFVAARRHSDCPVTVVNTKEEFRERCGYVSK